MRRSRMIPLLTLITLFSAVVPSVAEAEEGGATLGKPPQPVSPAGESTVCPTFSWSQVPNASGYELVVYAVTGTGEASAEPVRSVQLPAGAAAWTLPASACLAPGARYAWSVRSLPSTPASRASDWSEPVLFAVAASPTPEEVRAALATLRRYLEGKSEREDSVETKAPGSSVESIEESDEFRGVLEALAESPGELGARPLEVPGLEAPRANDPSDSLEALKPGSHNSTAAIRAIEPSTSGQSFGVYAESKSTSSTGVVGTATAVTGATTGVLGSSRSSEGIGVHGSVSAVEGVTHGVVGKSASTQGRGVYGHAFSGSGSNYGVFGESESTQGRGVYGRASAVTGLNYGVYGATNSPGGWAGYFLGNAHVTGDLSVAGTLTKGMGSFKIDHPLDPANRYLSHSFVESPDMKNVYDGVVALDHEGGARVELPEWFEALNRDFRYQLTALGTAAPGLHVSERISGNRFRIAGGEPGMEVSWQVTGIRRDAYAEQNPIPVEEDKGDQRGRYLHPEAFGEPPELAIGYHDPEETLARPTDGLPEPGDALLDPGEDLEEDLEHGEVP